MPATLYAEDYRLSGYTDLQTLTAAFAAWVSQGGELYLKPGYTYNLGNYSTANGVVFTLSGIDDAILAGNGATIAINTNGNAQYDLILVAAAKRVRFRDLTLKDTGFDPSQQFRGAILFAINGNHSVQSQDISFENVHGDGGVAFIQTKGIYTPAPSRIDGVHIAPNCSARNCFYGLNCQENGDNITGGFSTFKTLRAYFPYGVSNHDLALIVEDDGSGPAAECSCLIKRYTLNTRNIRLRVVFRGTFELSPNASSPGCFVKLEMQPDGATAPGRIDNVDLTIELDENLVNTYDAHVLGFRSYLENGTEETSTTANVWSNIRLDGTFRDTSYPNVMAYVSPTTPCLISLAPGLTGASPYHLTRRPGFIFRTAENSEFYLRGGDLTAAPIPIDLVGLDSHPFTIKVKTYVLDKESSLYVQNSVYREDIITGYNAGGASAVAIQGTRSCFTPLAQGTAPTVSFAASGETIQVSISGANYDETDSYARVEVEYVSQGKLTRG